MLLGVVLAFDEVCLYEPLENRVYGYNSESQPGNSPKSSQLV